MKILIVGGNSNLARTLKPLLSSYAEVLTAGRSHCDVPMDLSQKDGSIEIPDGIDCVINAAAAFGGGAPNEISETFDVNVSGLLRLCEACHHAGVKYFVQVSSVFAKMSSKALLKNPYALSKKHAEEVLHLFSELKSLRLLIIQPSQIYGAGEAFRRHQPFLYAIADKAQAGEEIVLFGQNDALRNFIHVADVAQVIARAVEKNLTGTYSCLYPQDIRYSEIAKQAVKAFGSNSVVRFDKSKPDISDVTFENDDSLFVQTGFWPKISIAEGMTLEAAWRKKVL
jgi:nucleoside-diphosphate-sugar epimerase